MAAEAFEGTITDLYRRRRADPARTSSASRQHPERTAHERAQSDQSAKSFPPEIGEAEEIVVHIPGTEPPDGVPTHLINTASSRGLVASIIHLKRVTAIAAHSHEGFAETHNVIEGNLINDGAEFGPDSCITHRPGVVHGPHASKGGCRVLTIQTGYPGPEQSDHPLVGGNAGKKG